MYRIVLTVLFLPRRLKQTKDQVPRQFLGAELADFCEVVVTKAEPLDEIQSHNGFGEVPSQVTTIPFYQTAKNVIVMECMYLCDVFQ